MFVPVWLIFLGTGLLMAIGTVLWAVRTGQFEDQERARFLPLHGLTAPLPTPPPISRHLPERIGLCTLLGLGLASVGAVLFMLVLGS